MAARAEDTLRTLLFDVGWPDATHRVLRNATTDEWERAGRPPSGQRPGEGTLVGRYSVAGETVDVRKYGVDPPMASFDGDIEQTALYCGQSCSLVHDIRPAGQIVHELSREAHALLAPPRTDATNAPDRSPVDAATSSSSAPDRRAVRSPGNDRSPGRVARASLVAGAGFEPATFGL